MARQFKTEGDAIQLTYPNAEGHFSGCQLLSKELLNCSISAKSVKSRPVIDGFEIRRIHHIACHLSGAIIREGVIEDLKGGGLTMSFAWGCAFSKVHVRGWISGIQLRWRATAEESPINQVTWQANKELYESIEWALDISDARFTSFQVLEGIPSNLVRRDTSRQFAISRTQAEQVKNNFPGTIWSVVAEELLESPQESVVIVPGDDRRCSDDVMEAQRLRDIGVLS